MCRLARDIRNSAVEDGGLLVERRDGISGAHEKNGMKVVGLTRFAVAPVGPDVLTLEVGQRGQQRPSQ